jgi:hypothetical protein
MHRDFQHIFTARKLGSASTLSACGSSDNTSLSTIVHRPTAHATAAA